MSSIFLILISAIFACDYECEQNCLSLKRSSACFPACRCPYSRYFSVSQSFPDLVYTEWGCPNSIIDSCVDSESIESCIEQAGCSPLSPLASLISSVPPMQWKSIDPAELQSSTQFVSNRNKLVSCSDCGRMVGDDYWACISEYCTQSDYSKYSHIIENIKKISPNRQNQISGIVIATAKSKGIEECACHAKCNYNFDDYNKCITECNNNDCAIQNEKSFRIMKDLMASYKNTQETELQNKVNKFDGNFVSCNKLCIESNCKNGNFGCFDNCLNACNINHEKSIENLSKSGVFSSDDASFHWVSVLLSSLLLVMLCILAKSVYKKLFNSSSDNFAAETPYKLII